MPARNGEGEKKEEGEGRGRGKERGDSREVGILVSKRYFELSVSALQSVKEKLQAQGVSLRFVVLPTPAQKTEAFSTWDFSSVGHGLSAEDLSLISAAYLSEDLQMNWTGMMAFVHAVLAAPNVRWMQFSWIGIDFPIFPPIQQKEPTVYITNASGSNALAVATSTLAAILALNRGLHKWVMAQTKHQWLNREELHPRRDLAGQKVLVFGFGSIGQHIGKMCSALGMCVQGVQRSAVTHFDEAVAKEIISTSTAGGTEKFEAAVAEADYVVVSTPLTEQTKNTFSRERLSTMKPSACLLNVGRGAVVDEDALAEMLGNGRLRGAYMDVFTVEPLPEQSPLWGLNNVILSPHDSSTCADNPGRMDTIFLDNLLAFATEGITGLNNVVSPVSKSKL